MHYIRLLKAPKVEIVGTTASVKTLITITTDLGDDFLCTETEIFAALLRDGMVVARQRFLWKAHARALKLDFNHLPKSALQKNVVLVVGINFENLTCPMCTSTSHLPGIAQVWSEPFDIEHCGASRRVIRKFQASRKHRPIDVCEEIGESIARHIWDAGIVLAAFIQDALLVPHFLSEGSALASGLQSLRNPNVKAIELGSGCGIVGLNLADACSEAQILLTDLPDAMEILNGNISRLEGAVARRVQSAIVDWDQDLPQTVAREDFGLIIISDCTYNCDSIPSLVKTLSALAARSQDVIIIVSMKVRHESEAVFHELMFSAAFEQIEQHHGLALPDRHRSMTGQELETVDIYVYRKVHTSLGPRSE